MGLATGVDEHAVKPVPAAKTLRCAVLVVGQLNFPRATAAPLDLDVPHDVCISNRLFSHRLVMHCLGCHAHQVATETVRAAQMADRYDKSSCLPFEGIDNLECHSFRCKWTAPTAATFSKGGCALLRAAGDQEEIRPPFACLRKFRVTRGRGQPPAADRLVLTLSGGVFAAIFGGLPAGRRG